MAFDLMATVADVCAAAQLECPAQPDDYVRSIIGELDDFTDLSQWERAALRRELHLAIGTFDG